MKKPYKAIGFAVVTWVSLTYFIQIRVGNELSAIISLRYLLVALGIATYTYLLEAFNLRKAWLIFLVFFAGATAYLGMNMSLDQTPFTDLGTILMWMILTGTGVIAGLAFELVRAIIRNNASSK